MSVKDQAQDQELEQESTSQQSGEEAAASSTQEASGGGDSAASKDSGSIEAGGDGAQAAAPEYTPNFKFKALDKELEMDEWVRPFVNKDTEAKFREIFEKATGLEHFKQTKEKLSQKAQVLEHQYTQAASQIQTATKLLREGNYGRLFEFLGLPEEKLYGYLVDKIETEEKLKDMPPHVREMYNNYQKLREQNEAMESQIHELASRPAPEVQARTFELQAELTKPEVASAVQQFDERAGFPGAFKEYVISHAARRFQMTANTEKPVDLSAGEAVTEVLKILGLQSVSEGTSQVPKPNQQTSAPKVITTSKKPAVIPNLGGGAPAPASKKVTSLDDIRALAKQMSAD